MMTSDSSRRHTMLCSLINRAMERAEQRGQPYTDSDELLRMCGLFEWAPMPRQAREYAVARLQYANKMQKPDTKEKS